MRARGHRVRHRAEDPECPSTRAIPPKIVSATVANLRSAALLAIRSSSVPSVAGIVGATIVETRTNGRNQRSGVARRSDEHDELPSVRVGCCASGT